MLCGVLKAPTLWKRWNFKQNCLEARIRNRSDRFRSKTRAHNKKKALHYSWIIREAPFLFPDFLSRRTFSGRAENPSRFFTHCTFYYHCVQQHDVRSNAFDYCYFFSVDKLFWRRLKLLSERSLGRLQMTSAPKEKVKRRHVLVLLEYEIRVRLRHLSEKSLIE